MTIKIGKYDICCRWTTDARLPVYLGSALRGAFGWALKKDCCLLNRQKCSSCLLHERCIYAHIFETEKYPDNTGRNINARPHPFIFQPGSNTSGNKKAGETWDFSLTLIGRCNDSLPQLISTIKTMGEDGIGNDIGRGFGRFTIENILAGKKELYRNKKVLDHSEATTVLQLSTNNITPTKTLAVSLLTPLRLKQDNALLRNVSFSALIRAALRRISAIEAAYGEAEPEFDYQGLVQRAEMIEEQQASIQWKEQRRYSNRQKQEISLSGLQGSALYCGDLTEFIPLLEYTRHINLGKQTAFGLGNFSIKRLSET